jgi:hypothetical protein
LNYLKCIFKLTINKISYQYFQYTVGKDYPHSTKIFGDDSGLFLELFDEIFQDDYSNKNTSKIFDSSAALNFAKTMKRYSFDIFNLDKKIYEIVFRLTGKSLYVDVTSIRKMSLDDWAPIENFVTRQLDLLFGKFAKAIESPSPVGPETCMKIRGVTLCGLEDPSFFEKQELGRCVLHSTNNLVQNTMRGEPLFTVQDFDDECEKIAKKRERRACEKGYGGYSHEIPIELLNKRGFFVNYDDLYTDKKNKSKDEYFTILFDIFDKLKTDTSYLGVIIAYDTQEGYIYNHAVSVFYRNKKFYVIDSGSSSGAYVFSMTLDVVTYFRTDKFLWAITVMMP